jgi:hypothetical protein
MWGGTAILLLISAETTWGGENSGKNGGSCPGGRENEDGRDDAEQSCIQHHLTEEKSKEWEPTVFSEPRGYPQRVYN